MTEQYLVVAGLVMCIIIWQLFAYYKNELRIKKLFRLFATQADSIVYTDTEGNATIRNNNGTEEFQSTLKDLNSYLLKNKNKTSDYHIIKEIVDRNAQSLEDEVDTMLSTPLYLGLMATILGIAIGVVSFAWNDLTPLFSGEKMESQGIRTLLTDVGIAMIASFVGVFATKMSTSHFNAAKVTMQRNKNKFLTWIQTELMPNLTDDMMGAVLKMTSDLNAFNNTFSENTKELQETLKTVTDNYEGQIEILNAIERIKITKVAKANIDVYDKLQGCTEELEKLFYYIANSEEYLTKVKELNENIDKVEERTKLFEELGNYFKNEIEFVKDRQGMMRQHMSGLDSVLQGALSDLGNSVDNSLQELTLSFQKQNQRVQQLIEEQQNSLIDSLGQQAIIVNQRISQIDNPFEGIKDSFLSVSEQAKQSVAEITATFQKQNDAIQKMLEEQRAMIKASITQQQIEFAKQHETIPGQMTIMFDIKDTLCKISTTLCEREMTERAIPDMNQKVSMSQFPQKLISFSIVGIFAAILALIFVILFDVKF